MLTLHERRKSRGGWLITSSGSRRFYWLWGVAVPFLVFLVVHILVSRFAESQMMGLAAGVPLGITAWYVAESYYLRRDEKQNRRSREQR